MHGPGLEAARLRDHYITRIVTTNLLLTIFESTCSNLVLWVSGPQAPDDPILLDTMGVSPLGRPAVARIRSCSQRRIQHPLSLAHCHIIRPDLYWGCE